MLTRQRTVLVLLAQAGRPLSPTVFAGLVFLLRQETILEKDRNFYDFVPYDFGPFSFTLHRDLGTLRQNGCVTPDEDRVALCDRTGSLVKEEGEDLPSSVRAAVADVLDRYGRMNQKVLIRDICGRYPWFSRKGNLPERALMSIQHPKKAHPAVYTAGYEGRSVDAFFNDLLKRGIHMVIDVRANPVSRKYGFSTLRLGEFCEKLELEYRHMPTLGIPSAARAGLNGFASYQRLLKQYEEEVIPDRSTEVKEIAGLMYRQPSVLVCVEKDVQCCHRSRLAEAVARETGLDVVHL